MTIPRFYLIIALAILLPISNLSGQTDTTKFKDLKQYFDYQHLNGHNPIFVIKFNSSTIIADTSILRKIDPTWIKSIKILKYGKDSVLRDPPSNDPTIFIEIRHRYIKKLKQFLINNKYVT